MLNIIVRINIYFYIIISLAEVPGVACEIKRIELKKIRFIEKNVFKKTNLDLFCPCYPQNTLMGT